MCDYSLKQRGILEIWTQVTMFQKMEMQTAGKDEAKRKAGIKVEDGSKKRKKTATYEW